MSHTHGDVDRKMGTFRFEISHVYFEFSEMYIPNRIKAIATLIANIWKRTFTLILTF